MKGKQKMFIVTYIDYGENCDGHARLLGTYKTREKAQLEINADIRKLVKVAIFGTKAVYRPNEVWASNEEIGTHGCVWDIHEVGDPQ
jgi:hypothetical protein